jgi:O-antigen ligase
MTNLFASSPFDRARLMPLADWLAVGVAVTLPWSTSGTSIFIILWLLAAMPAMDAASLRRTIAEPAAALPVLLWLLAVAGMFWADVDWSERLGGLGGFHRFLLIPLLLVHFRRSERGMYVLYAFFAATLCLLAVSFGLALIPGLPWRGSSIGVPVKDYIFQSMNFIVCAFALFGYAVEVARGRAWRWTVAALALALLFLVNILFVVSSRTVLVVIPVLLLLFGWWEFRWKGAIGAAVLGCALGVVLWSASPYLHARLATTISDFEAYRTNDQPNSTGLHLEFMRRAVLFVETAPIIGHGTGSIPDQYRRSAVGGEGASAASSENPHNQILAIGVQLGCVGMIVLLAMWAAHVWLFIREVGLTAWIGTIVVAQNIASSLFNSHLFDFTSGWLYVFGVGVAGGMVLRQRDSAKASAAKPSRVS